MKKFMLLSGIMGTIIFGAIGTVALLVFGITAILAPFWAAACMMTAGKLQDKYLDN